MPTDKLRFSSVWDAIEDTTQHAASLRVRSELMMSLTDVIRPGKGVDEVLRITGKPKARKATASATKGVKA